MKRYIWIFSLTMGVLLLCCAVAFVLFYSEIRVQQQEVAPLANSGVTSTRLEAIPSAHAEQETPKILIDGISQAILKDSFAYSTEWTVHSGSRILLMPHHLDAGRDTAGFLNQIEQPSVIYVVTPDLTSQCPTEVCVTEYGFETPFGGMRGSPDAVQAIASEVSGITDTTAAFETRSSMHYVASFIAGAWPGIRLVPILINPYATASTTQELSQALARRLQADPGAYVITATEATRQQAETVAEFHDQMTMDVIWGLADLETGRTDVDAPAALSVALKTARQLDLGDVVLDIHYSTSTSQTASYYFASFAPGTIQKQERLSLLFLGDVMLDRYVATRSQRAGGLDYPFEKIAGQDQSFFQGQDLVIANLEGPVTAVRRAPDKGDVDFAFDPKVAPMLATVGIDAVSQANNHTLDQGRAGSNESHTALSEAGLAVFGDQVNDDVASSLVVLERRGIRVGLLGFNVTDNPLNTADAEAALRAAYEQARYVVVYIHWGNEYQSNPSMKQTELAHWFIDQGVDAVIGAHPHWMQSIEVYRDRPIIYSLGNFIFDQDWSTETNYGLVAGLVIGEDGADVHLFPIRINESQPSILTGKDRKTRLERLANISTASLSSQIKQGVIHTP